MLRLPDPCLVVLVGPAGSGKSTWAAEHVPAGTVVSSDALRATVGEGEHDLAASADAFAVLEQVVAARLRRGLTTVVDTLGLDLERRSQWRRAAEAHGLPTVLVRFDVPAAGVRRRNADRAPRVPPAVVTSQLATYAEQAASFEAEGWSHVIAAEPVRLVAPDVAAAARRPATPPPGDPAPRTRRLRFGLHLSHWPRSSASSSARDAVTDVARRAETAGLDSIWVMDHLRQIPQVGRPYDDMLEAVAVLGHLGAVTERVELGALVHGVSLRNVGLLGKSLATLDVLNGGRTWCGLGAGWFDAEQRAYGYPALTRSERLDLLADALEALPLLWGRGSPAYEGDHVHLPEAMGYPRPLRGRIPILVGGQGPRRTLRLVAEHADACNLFGDPDAVRDRLTILHRHCTDVGRDPSEIEVTHLSTALVAPDPHALTAAVDRRAPPQGRAAWLHRVRAGTVDDHVLRVRALRDAGVDTVITSLVGLWDSDALETWAAVVREVAAEPHTTR